MIIDRLELQNMNSFGQKIQKIEFTTTGQLILLAGKNGSGKCVSPDTKITISIENEKIREEFLEFLKKNAIITESKIKVTEYQLENHKKKSIK